MTPRKAKGKRVDDPDAENPRLPGVEGEEEQTEAPATPLAVRGEWMQINYLRPHFDQDKEGARRLKLEFSVPLTDAHKDMFSAQISRSWKSLVALGNKHLDILGVEGHTVDLGFSPEDQHLRLTSWVEKCSVSMVEERGKGGIRQVVRLQFRLGTYPEKEVIDFAVNNYGETVWIRMRETQGKL
jgi:hypothetical protein